MIFIAIVMPGLSFLLRKKWSSAAVAFVLQALAIYSLFPLGFGFVLWLAIAVWAVMAYNYAQNPKQAKKK